MFLQCVLTWSALNPCKAFKKQRKTFKRGALAHFNKDMLSISYESVHFAPVTLEASVWSSYLFQFQSYYDHTNRIQVLLFINCWFSDFHSSKKAVLLGFGIFSCAAPVLFKVFQDTFGLLLLV